MTTHFYEDHGAGFPIILIHGHPFNRTMWAPQTAFLGKHYRVIVPDLCGYGENRQCGDKTLLSTFASDVRGLADLLGLEKFGLGGSSMGGQIVLECYRQFRERIAALVLADTFAQLDTPERKQLRLTTADRLISEGMGRYSDEELQKMIAPEHITSMPAVAEHVLRMMKNTSPRGAAAALRGRAERVDYTPLLPKIDVPVLIIVGDRDQYTPVPDAQFMHNKIRDSKIAVIDHAGHMANLEQPDAFNRIVLEFLASVLPDVA
jgi:pimeloyl-ACP methyl ester carboxylesterase